MAGKRATSADVAAAAGVSRSTVSYVLNPKPGYTIPPATRQRVLDAAARLDYRPHSSAKRLAAGRSDIVVLSLPDAPIGVTVSRFVEELAGALAAGGLTLVTHFAGIDGRPVPDLCAAVDAAAAVLLTPFEEQTADALRRMGIRVLAGADDAEIELAREVGLLQGRYLIEKGHRRLGCAQSGRQVLRYAAELRHAGLREACSAAGLDDPLVLPADDDLDQAVRAVDAWRRAGVTAVAANNDETAFAVLAGLHARGLSAPEQLAVIGCDDIPAARFATPALTTIAFDLSQAGREVAAAIIASLADEPFATSSKSVGPRIVPRASA